MSQSTQFNITINPVATTALAQFVNSRSTEPGAGMPLAKTWYEFTMPGIHYFGPTDAGGDQNLMSYAGTGLFDPNTGKVFAWGGDYRITGKADLVVYDPSANSGAGAWTRHQLPFGPASRHGYWENAIDVANRIYYAATTQISLDTNAVVGSVYEHENTSLGEKAYTYHVGASAGDGGLYMFDSYWGHLRKYNGSTIWPSVAAIPDFGTQGSAYYALGTYSAGQDATLFGYRGSPYCWRLNSDATFERLATNFPEAVSYGDQGVCVYWCEEPLTGKWLFFDKNYHWWSRNTHDSSSSWTDESLINGTIPLAGSVDMGHATFITLGAPFNVVLAIRITNGLDPANPSFMKTRAYLMRYQ